MFCLLWPLFVISACDGDYYGANCSIPCIEYATCSAIDYSVTVEANATGMSWKT